MRCLYVVLRCRQGEQAALRAHAGAALRDITADPRLLHAEVSGG